MKNKIVLVAVAVFIVLVTFVTALNIYKKGEAEKASEIAKSDSSKFVPDYAPKLGPDNAKVTLVEFLDPECESCREFYPLVKMIMDEAPGQIQLVVRYAPFHGNSKFAIKILEAARKQGKYWEALENLFRYQPQWGSHHHPQPELIWKYLPETGVDIEKIKVDMNDPAIDTMIAAEEAAVRELGVRGTPSFFVNGKPLQNFGYEPLRDLVFEALREN